MINKVNHLYLMIESRTIVFLFAWILWISAEFFLLGKYSFFPIGDNVDVIVTGLMRSKFLGAGEHLWDVFPAAGSDRMSMAFIGFVDVLLFTHLPAWLAFQIRIVSQVVVSTLAVYALGRTALSLSKPASFFAAGAYSLISHPGSILSSVVAYQPAAILAVIWVLRSRTDVRRWLLLGLVVSLISYTGYISQLVPFPTIALFAWFVFIDTPKRVSDSAIILIAAVSLVVLRSNELFALSVQEPLSALELIRLPGSVSNTVNTTIEYALFDPVRAACAGLFLYALIVGTCRRLPVIRLSLFLAASLLLPTVLAVLKPVFVEFIPVLSRYEFSRALSTYGIAVAFAGGMGVDMLRSVPRNGHGKHLPAFVSSWRVVPVVIAAGVLMFGTLRVKFDGAKDWITQGNYVQNFESPVIESLARTIHSQLWPVRVASFQMYPTYLHPYNLETAGGYQSVYSKRYFAYWDKMMSPWLHDIKRRNTDDWIRMKRIRDKVGGEVLYRDYRLMLAYYDRSPEIRFEDLYHLNMLSLANVAYVISRDRLIHPDLEALREAPVPWHAMSRRDKISVMFQGNLAGRTHLYVYRNKSVIPRFFTVSNIKVFRNERAVLDAVALASVKQLRRTAFVENESLPASLDPNRSYDNAEIFLEKYSPNEIRLRVKSRGPSVLIVGNSFSPYWICEIDGVRTDLFPAYNAFWGVPLPGSAESVVFRYAPPRLWSN